jgi:rod shape-determining protein MreD
MESRRKRTHRQIQKWACYGLLLLLCTVLQTTPGLLQLGQAKPLFILPLCIAVAVFEGEFAGGLFAVVGGLMWDYVAGRTVGLLTLFLLVLCFFLSVIVQLYLKSSLWNLVLLGGAAALLILSIDWLFFYYMPGYSGGAERYVRYVLPSAVLSMPVEALLCVAVRAVSERMKIDKGNL